MKLTSIKQTIAVLGCVLTLGAPAAFGQVMSGSNPNPACTNLQLWLNASAGVATSGASVIAWTNQATSTIAVTNATTNALPTQVGAPGFVAASTYLNGKPAIAFSTNLGLNIINAGTMISGAYTMFTVVAPTNIISGYAQPLLGNNNNMAYVTVTASGNSGAFKVQQNANATIASTATFAVNTSNILSATSSGTGAGNTKLYIQGVENDNATSVPVFSTIPTWNLGWQTNTATITRFFNGHIAEVLVYQGVLTASDRAKVTSYLGVKYGITVPSVPVTTPTFSVPSGTYAEAQSVTISSDLGAAIFYTTNGTTPNNTSLSGTSPLVVTVPVSVTNFTITAYSTNSGFANSALATNTYTTVAITPTWINPVSGNSSWANNLNWSNNAVANGIGVTADFSQLAMQGDEGVTLDGAWTVGNLLLGDLNNSANWYIAIGANNSQLTLNAGANTPVITVLNPSVTFVGASTASVLAGTSGLIKTGAGTMILSGLASYSGPTTVSNGILEMDNVGTIGSLSITNNATVNINATSGAFIGLQSLHGNGTWTINGDGTGTTYNSAVAAGHASSPIANSDNTGTISIVNSGRLNLQLWTLTAQAIGNTAGVYLDPGASLNLYGVNGAQQTIGGLTGSGTVDFPDGGAGTNLTLAVGGGNSTASFSGVIENSASYPYYSGGPTVLSLIKVGSGTQTLSGADTYTGNTTVNGGTLEIVQSTIATNSAVMIASGAVLQLDFTTTNAVGSIVLNGVRQAAGVYNSTTASPYIAGTGSLLVSSSIATDPTNITVSVSGNTLNLTWPADHLGWILQSNSVSLAVPSDWYDISGTAATTNYSITVNPGTLNVFYRLRMP